MHTQNKKKRTPVVPNVKEWIDVAKALIDKHRGEELWSGLTLNDWHAVLISPETKFINKSLAVAAVRGLAAQYMREQLGSCGDRLQIVIAVIPDSEGECSDACKADA